MCYDVVANTKSEKEYAILRGDVHYAEELEKRIHEWEAAEQFQAYYHISGFDHPNLLTFTNMNPRTPQLYSWGLIPKWTKSREDAQKIRNTTLNARSETMFDKPAFRNSAMHKRCLIYVDSFFEHHDLNGKKYPFRIHLKSNEPMIMAGLWEEWLGKETGKPFYSLSIVTTEANELLAKIHNKPAKSETHRMPVILPKDRQEEWLQPINSELDKTAILNLCIPSDQEMLAYPVGTLRGKMASPNSIEALKEIAYPGLSILT